MNAEPNEFRLSAAEFAFLSQIVLGDKSAADLLKNHELRQGGQAVVRLTRTETEQLREFLTVRLAIVGFQGDYSLTEQGRILEELIDRFFVP